MTLVQDPTQKTNCHKNTDQHSSSIILLSDIIEQKLRKERELHFYEEQLELLMVRMESLKKEINVTNTIIRIVSEDKVIDLQQYIEDKKLEE